MRGKLILVTGGNGFIGRRLCTQLRAQGARVRALLRTDAQGPWDERVLADLTQPDLPGDCMKDIDSVFHLAGKAHAVDEIQGDYSVYERINVDGTRKLLEAAETAGVGQFIFFSSVKAIGEGDVAPLDEESAPQPVTAYGKSKLRAEHLVLAASGIAKVAVIRPAMVYGPGHPGNLKRMIAAVRSGYFPPWPPVENKRSMVHVEDLIMAAILIHQDARADWQTYIVTDGEYYSTRQIYTWICAALGVPLRQWWVPLPLLAGLAKIGDVLSWVLRKNVPYNSVVFSKVAGSSAYDSAKIRKTLGYEPTWTLESALPEIVGRVK